jgi:hypothetical protein
MVEEAPSSQNKVLDDLKSQFCFFQLPINLPIKGCFTPGRTEEGDPDIELNPKDPNILKSFLSKKFDSTGFLLDKDAKLFEEGQAHTKETQKKKDIEDEALFETVKIGKMCVMKDGSIKMKIGQNFFDVMPGVQDHFYKEVISVDVNKKQAVNLTAVERKIIVKPDLNSFDL